MPKAYYRDSNGTFIPLPTAGPAGPEGPAAISADAGNLASLGSDSAVYVTGWGRWEGTQAEYDALGTYDPDVLYAING